MAEKQLYRVELLVYAWRCGCSWRRDRSHASRPTLTLLED